MELSTVSDVYMFMMKLLSVKLIPVTLLAVCVLNVVLTEEALPETPAPVPQVEMKEAGLGNSASDVVAGTECAPEPSAISLAAARGNFTWFGLSAEQAKAKAAAEKIAYRVVSIDGKLLPTTRDYREGRINATLIKGQVPGAQIEGIGAEGCFDLALLPYIGLSVTDAVALALEKKVPSRVISRDGESLPATADMILDRVNFAIIKDRVMAVSNG